MPYREVADIIELKTLVGQEVAVSDWVEITQERIDRFAVATDDPQWIHADTPRTRAESPFGGPIAHGYLTLSMFSHLDGISFGIKQTFSMTINAGLNKLRFMGPVRAGARIRSRTKLLSLADVRGGWRANWKVTIDIEGEKHPACIAEVVIRYMA